MCSATIHPTSLIFMLSFAIVYTAQSFLCLCFFFFNFKNICKALALALAYIIKKFQIHLQKFLELTSCLSLLLKNCKNSFEEIFRALKKQR